MKSIPLPLAFLVLAILPATTLRADSQWTILDPPGQAGITLLSDATGASELSGIAWAGGNQFYVVGDGGSIVYPLSIVPDLHAATITSATLQSGVTLSAGADLEGLAYDAANAAWWLSDETGPAIRAHALADGSLLQSLTLPSVFQNVRGNLSLESLSRQADGLALWTANEEALSVDGPVSSVAAGSVVRLQRFDASGQAAGQWAYLTDALSGDVLNPGRDIEVSGVVDLVVLPGGQLLALERALGPTLFRHRLYEVDFTGASDVSAIPALDGASYTAVGKHLLWEHTGGVNFEGISLGPELANQGRMLVLVSDDGNGLSQELYALVLLPAATVCDTQPRTDCRSAGGSRLALASAGGSRDKLTWSWRKGTLEDFSGLGDPSSPVGHGLALCVYDSEAGSARLRLALAVGLGSGWSTVPGKKIAYADRDGTAAGITKIKIRPGLGSAQVQVSGKGPGLALPPPPLTGNLLSRDPTIRVQLVNRDHPAECFDATFTSAARESTTQFKAAF